MPGPTCEFSKGWEPNAGNVGFSIQKKLLSIEGYRRFLGKERSIADLLVLSGVEDLDLPLIQPSELALATDLS